MNGVKKGVVTTFSAKHLSQLVLISIARIVTMIVIVQQADARKLVAGYTRIIVLTRLKMIAMKHVTVVLNANLAFVLTALARQNLDLK